MSANKAKEINSSSSSLNDIPEKVDNIILELPNPINDNINPASQSMKRMPTYAPQIHRERIEKLITSNIVYLYIAMMLTISKLNTNINGYHLIAISLGCVIVAMLIYFMIALCSTKHLHYIRVKRRRLPNSRFIFVPYDYEEMHSIPMSSISAVAAMRGSNLDRIANAATYLTCGFIMSAVFMKWTESNNTMKIEFELILLTASGYGSYLLSVFELEVFSSVATRMHYFAVALCALSPFAFGFHQLWSTYSITICCIMLVCVVVWICMVETVERMNFDEKNGNLHLVHKYSLLCIITEWFILLSCFWASVSFIFCMSNDRNIIL